MTSAKRSGTRIGYAYTSFENSRVTVRRLKSRMSLPTASSHIFSSARAMGFRSVPGIIKPSRDIAPVCVCVCVCVQAQPRHCSCVCVCVRARNVLQTSDPKKVLIHGEDHAIHQRLLIKERELGDGPEVDVGNAPIGKCEDIARMWVPVE